MARPRKQLDAEQIEKMAMIGNPVTAIATILGCSTKTLHRRFGPVIKKGQERGNNSLRLMQYQKALDGNITMLIWLGKQRLGQSDRTEINQTTSMSVRPSSPQEAAAAIEAAYAAEEAANAATPRTQGGLASIDAKGEVP